LPTLSYNKNKVSSVDVVVIVVTAAAAAVVVAAVVSEAVCQWPLLRLETPRATGWLAAKHP